MHEVLTQQGISEELIVSGSGRTIEQGSSLSVDHESSNIQYAYEDTEKNSIAFFLAGGLGDCIIDKKFILALLDKAESDISVDLYGDIYNEECIKSFFRDCDCVKNIISGKKIYQSTYKK